MAWDTSVPASSDFISLGDDVIRTLKTDLQIALRGNAATGTEAIFPGSDTANPIFRYRGLKGTTAARPSFGEYGLYINTTLNTLQRDNGSAWEDVATLIPSGTKMPFYQASPPTGWTAVAVNDKFMRVVTSAGTGGTTGGSIAASTSLAHTHTVNSHTHDLSNHTHAGPAHTHTIPITGYGSGGTTTTGKLLVDDATGNDPDALSGVDLASTTPNSGSDGTGATGAPSNNTSGATSPGTDSQLGVFAYADFCVGTKD